MKILETGRRTVRGRFNVGSAQMFRLAWRQYRQDKARPLDTWWLHQETILHAWRCFMQAVLAPVTWGALQLYLERWADLRLTWIRPGGYFFTRASNRRKRIVEKLRPRHTVTLTDGVERARALYLEALEGEGCADVLPMAVLVLSGAIYSGRRLKRRTAKGRHKPARVAIPEANRWPWPRSVNKRLRALRRTGLLTQPDWREVRL